MKEPWDGKIERVVVERALRGRWLIAAAAEWTSVVVGLYLLELKLSKLEKHGIKLSE